MGVIIDLRPHRGDVLCEFCGESMDSQGNDPWDLLFTSHYCDAGSETVGLG